MESFLNREDELAYLSKVHRRKGPQLMVVYGRRRIGKTLLLTHWLTGLGPGAGAYWVAHRSSSDVLLRSFSAVVAPLVQGAQQVVFDSWEAALRALVDAGRTRRLAFVLDEFPYLVQAEPRVPSLLQMVWDESARRGSKLRLVLSGSHYQMMHDELLSPRQPLYGRSTAALLLDEIAPKEMRLFLPHYSPEQVVETYGVIGGVPKYLELWNDQVPVLRNIRELVLSPVTLFRHEATYLIQEEIAEPRTYLAILEAIGAGLKTPSMISRDTGVATNHISKYLHTLVALRILRRVLSADITHPGSSRKGRYEIRDPFLRFHFHYVFRRPDLVEQGRFDALFQIVRSTFESYVGAAGFEELARRHVAQLADSGELAVDQARVGRLWDRDVEIDVAAVDDRNRHALLGECKWQRRKMGAADLADLQQRAKRIRRLEGFTKTWALFSRAGFTRALSDRSKKEPVILFSGPRFERV